MELTEELAFMKRRRMEGKGRDHQVRRVHIVYFLSRMGRVEHPHLIRVHHLNRNGVYLRDVKRWLADLRGKDMPESFAWSYKRRYKTGYVWQDLLDDDLITPISDNEYVLKGSQISSFSFETEADPCSDGDSKATIQKQQPVEIVHLQEASTEEKIQGHPDSEMRILAKISSEINQESPPFGSETSTLTDDSMKLEQEKHVEEAAKPNLPQHPQNFTNSSSYSNFMNKKSKKKKKNKMAEQSSTTPASSSFAASHSPFTRGRSHSSGAAHMFRNLITCGAVHTRDSVIAVINRSNKPTNQAENKSEICRGEKLGGSTRIFGSPWNHQQDNARKSWDGSKDSKKKKKSGSELGNQKKVYAAYRPIAGPNCSQCGKSFKPEKMHAHMKSCKGMKASAKTAAAIEMAPSQRSVNFSTNEPASGYFLTH